MKYVLRMVLGWLLVVDLMAIISPPAGLFVIWLTAVVLSLGMFVLAISDIFDPL